MIFLDPKSDLAFKKLFGDIRHKDLLMSFLNSVLNLSEGNKIINVVFNDPHNVPETAYLKKSIVDVSCTDQSKKQYIVEMQVVYHDDYIARAQFYSSVALSRQLHGGKHYSTLVPVIFVGILDFKVFENQNYLTHHLILDTETHEHALKHLSFHFIELVKFNKKLEELTTVLDKWIYFLRHAEDLKKIPTKLNDSILSEAFDVLEQGNWSTQELFAYDAYLDTIRTTASQIESAKRIGKEDGHVKGKADGKREEKIAIARELLDVLDVETIAKKTKLTIHEVEELKKLQ